MYVLAAVDGLMAGLVGDTTGLVMPSRCSKIPNKICPEMPKWYIK